MDPHRTALDLTPEERAGLPSDGGEDFNRLVFEESPYLLQHAANPVDWYPWGDEAFQRARELDRPIFLSIGYSTCHWCHVMEEESFEDPEVAGLLNEHMVCIKVDREERPDIDSLYMTVTQGMTGGGGWPMTVIMTPDGRPFFAGTYFPRLSAPGRPGMVDLVPSMGEAWAERREEVLESAEEIREWLEGAVRGSAGGQVGAHLLPRAYEQLAQRYDAEWGGFGERPKFPTPHNLTFLLRFRERSGEDPALTMVEHTLQRMRQGGIFDQVGFGFHRYSVDRQWLVPHFEKMLYDQAGIALAAIETFQATGSRRYAGMAREVFTYVLRDMQGPEGGFYSAEDADSEGEEGRFYVWGADVVREVLGEEAELYMEVHGFTEEGNYREEASAQQTGRNIPHLPEPLETQAGRLGMDPAELTRRMEAA
ncbi:MAG: thioredoxin domain-containing protein, partial [bacterium]